VPGAPPAKVRTYNKFLGIPPSNVDDQDVERDPDIIEGPDTEVPRKKRKAGGVADGIVASGRADRPSRKRGGRLTAATRQSLPSSDFALPGKGAGPKGAGAGSYPIPDASHARNALARVSQHGSSGEKTAVRRKVAAKFPGIGQS
jgi:hypothetical protein